MQKYKQYLQLLIVFIGFLGIISYIIQQIVVTQIDQPWHSLHIFKYFTVQSNFVAIIYFLTLRFLPHTKESQKWNNFVGGVMIYTTITFLVFITILEPLWNETGFDAVGSISLHYINPILIIGYVFMYKKELTLTLQDSFVWVVYPAGYILFLTLWGIITGDYLYPFFQISEVGVLGFLLAITFLIWFFFMLSFVVVKILSKK